METVSVVSNLLEANCDDEFKKTFQKQKLKFLSFTLYNFNRCYNTFMCKHNTSERKPN